MFITLYAVMCLAAGGSCQPEIVTDQYLSPEMSIGSCLGIEGEVSAQKFKDEHPLYHSDKWRLGGWKCQIGNKPAPKRNEA